MKNAKSHLACGTCILALLVGLVAAPSAQAQNFRVLYSFAGPPDGAGPDAGLIADSAGNLYGTTAAGGPSSCPTSGPGCGTVFRLDKTGKETVLYSFTGGTDGALPFAGLVRDAAGGLYGTAFEGGNLSCTDLGSVGCGVVFKLDTTGTETVLHTFLGNPDGAFPYGGLLRDSVGNLYGTTSEGGGGNSGSCNGDGFGCGTVFEVDSTGTETVLYAFTGLADGGLPLAGLIHDSVGNFYGTTEEGGAEGTGAVFKVDKARKETVLYGFAGGTDGRAASAPLIRDSAGSLYGTTSGGGDSSVCSSGCGTVFKLDAAGAETVLYTFTGGTDGATPLAGLVRDAAGNLYGTTYFGGDPSCGFQGSGCGTVFEVDTTGKETVLHRFTGGIDGGYPRAGLIRGKAGNLYGTAGGGGAFGFGAVFELKP